MRSGVQSKQLQAKAEGAGFALTKEAQRVFSSSCSVCLFISAALHAINSLTPNVEYLMAVTHVHQVVDCSRAHFHCAYMYTNPWKKSLIKELLILIYLLYGCHRHQGLGWCIDLFPGSLFFQPSSAIIKAAWTKMAATAGCAAECLLCTTCRALENVNENLIAAPHTARTGAPFTLLHRASFTQVGLGAGSDRPNRGTFITPGPEGSWRLEYVSNCL